MLGARGAWALTTRGPPFDVNCVFPPEGFEFWSLDVNGGDEWKVEDQLFSASSKVVMLSVRLDITYFAEN